MTTTTEKYLHYFKVGIDMKDWYKVAHQDILIASKQLGTHPSYLAGLLAAFSPRVSVKRSCKWATNFAMGYGFMYDVPISVRTHVDKFVELGLVSGPKTGPFHRALLGDRDAIVIDTHMFKAAVFDTRGNKDYMEQCKNAIRNVSKHRCSPAEAQAAVWCGYLMEQGRTVSYMPLLEVLWDV